MKAKLIDAWDWITYTFDVPLCIVMALMLLAGWAFLAAYIRDDKAKKDHEAAFMAECQQDKKHYECEAMWRAGEDHEHMIPVVIPMPSGR